MLNANKPITALELLEDIRAAFALIRDQDQGCGGNLRPEEIYKAMKCLATNGEAYMRDIIKQTKS